MKAERKGWGLKYYSKNKLNGVTEHLMMNQDFYGKDVAIFRTRQMARDFRKEHYRWFLSADLKGEPHGWTFPKIVKVTLTMEEV